MDNNDPVENQNPEMPAEQQASDIVDVSSDSRNMAMLMWILTLFFGFIPCLIFFLVKDDDKYVKDQSREALNWCITLMIAYVAGLVLSLILIGVLVIFAAGICHLVFCIMGAIGTSNAQPFRVPFTFRFIS